MRVIDISGVVANGMWKYPDPYPPVGIEDLPPIEWVAGPCYSQSVRMSVQSGTYLETWAHWQHGAPTVDDVPVENLILDAVIVQVPKGPSESISQDEVLKALRRDGQNIGPGEAVLLATGWDSHWEAADFVQNPPFLEESCMQWIVQQKPTLIGMDTPRWVPPHYSYEQTAGFFRTFLCGTQNLILVCPVNLTLVPRPRATLIALPLKVTATVAAPCRAVLIFDTE